MKKLVISICFIYSLSSIVYSQSDKMMERVSLGVSKQQIENLGGDAMKDVKNQKDAKSHDRDRPDKSDKPSFSKELKDSATEAMIEADKCMEVAEIITDDDDKKAAYYLACWTKSVVDQTRRVVNGKTENCALPKDKNKYKKLPVY